MVIHRSPIVQNFQGIVLGRKCPQETDRAIERRPRTMGARDLALPSIQTGMQKYANVRSTTMSALKPLANYDAISLHS